jgi:lipoyl(octanoyl) transferase
MSTDASRCIFRSLGRQDYLPVWAGMKKFTQERNADCRDEIWFVEHNPVFTQGQAGKQEHLLAPGDIPVVQVDRGGQVTYHGPGQQVVYFLIDLKRKKIGVRKLVSLIEQITIDLLKSYQITSKAKSNAPGVYVEGKKICSLGLKIKRSCSYHGLALNVDMDKEPFSRINPCGYAGLEITQLADLNGPNVLTKIEADIRPIILSQLNYTQFENGLGF